MMLPALCPNITRLLPIYLMAKSGYINQKFLTPAQLNIKIDRLNKTIEKNNLANLVKYNALENFTVLLTAFAGHDIKNALLNMEGVVELLNINNIKF